MFYIGIAIAVCVGVYFGMSFSKDSKGTWDMIRGWWLASTGWIKVKCLKFIGWLKVLGKILLILAIVTGCAIGIYYFFSLNKEYWENLLLAVEVIGAFIAFYLIFFFVCSTLYKMTHRKEIEEIEKTKKPD